jgi:hypothetical protein
MVKKLALSRRLRSSSGAATVKAKLLNRASDARKASAYAMKPVLCTKRVVVKKDGHVTLRANRSRQRYVLWPGG